MSAPATLSAEATRILNHLASCPRYSNTTVTRKLVREIMLCTGGTLMSQGELWDIKAKSVGAGVYRLTLSLWKGGAS